MTALNAIDSIGPAFNRTLALLDKPRNWRFLWKFCLVAFFAEAGQSGGNFRSSIPNGSTAPFHSLSPLWLHLMLGAFGFLFVSSLLLVYVGSRLQFVLFEMVLRPNDSVREVWSRYGSVTWRLIGLKLLFLVAVLLTCLPILGPLLIHMFHRLPASGGQLPQGDLGGFFRSFCSLSARFCWLFLYSALSTGC